MDSLVGAGEVTSLVCEEAETGRSGWNQTRP